MFDKISLLLVDQLGVLPTEVTAETKLDDLGVDSLDRVEVILALEAEFGVEIPDEDFDRVLTVNDIEQLITGKLRAKVGQA